jgi:hypothetical protein
MHTVHESRTPAYGVGVAYFPVKRHDIILSQWRASSYKEVSLNNRVSSTSKVVHTHCFTLGTSLVVVVGGLRVKVDPIITTRHFDNDYRGAVVLIRALPS